MERAEVEPLEPARHQGRSRARDQQAAVGQPLETVALDLALGPGRKRLAPELDKDMPPIEQREAFAFRHVEDQPGLATPFAEVADHDIGETAAVAIGVNDADVLPGDVVVLLHVGVEIAGFREGHAERRSGIRLDPRQQAEVGPVGAEAA